MAIMKTLRHFTLILFAVSYLPRFHCQCPEAQVTAPCVCTEGSEIELTCEGKIGLTRLTIVLKNEFCGRTIHKLRIQESDIGYLPSNLFLKTVVNDIQISYTNISHFTNAGRSAFFGLEPHLRSLSMRRCGLVDGLQWHMIGDLRVLTYLDLSGNYLGKVEKKWFHRSPPNLRSLVLKENRIKVVESEAFAYMHKLIELDLSENQITVIRRDMLPYPGNDLVFLRMSYNNLCSLPADLFYEMMGLRRIYLDFNRLRTLQKSLWAHIWGDLEHVDLMGNDFDCDCDMSWVAELRPPLRLYGKCDRINSCFRPEQCQQQQYESDCFNSNNRTGEELKNLEMYHFGDCSTAL